MLRQICPILPARDIPETEAFYARLGFQTWYKDPQQYLLMNRDAVEIHFFAAPQHDPVTCDHAAYLRPDDVNALSAEIAALDLPNIEGALPRFAAAEDKPWGMREAVIWDPNGNLIRIGVEIP